MSDEHHIVMPERRKGRGARSNAGGRFERHVRVEASDGWDIPEDRGRFITQVATEEAKSLISYNRSPDLPFDRSINPYRGCEHGCVYCFARPSHAYLGLSPGLDFETRLIAKTNAPEVLARELRAKRYEVAPIAIGTNTDPYQPVERDRGLMRDCLKVLRDFRHPVAIVTKGTLIERDLDILAPMAAEGLVRVGISVTTLRDEVARSMEPRVPRPARRLETVRRLSEAGVPVRVMVSPVVPGLTEEEIEAILEAGRNAGARAASWIMLRLPREVSPLVQEWLVEHFPGRAGRIMARLREMHGGKDYDARWGHRMRGEGAYAEMIGKRFRLAIRRLEMAEPQPDLRRDLFAVPGGQMSLF
ncbi:PA0069 family radical SAM protein [Aquicoccus sp. G2-2]|uniref:PA0069 family radical SAM protein n=1 Tax=Aquicoccus sp. G2-2 TaxID=3092120 RepID=UPI002ADFD1A8|nr:PA0069 family radical SAM protein [Aquicoccus sp. G2-2]MEA1113053.1 PA0069 family radical SAM protein [Aquicoccus sp. G2-2]